LSRARSTYKRLTALGFPRHFPVIQFPNLPLIVALLAGGAAVLLHGEAHRYARSLAYLGTAVWAYEEMVDGVNWFRRLLGFSVAVILIVRVAHALH